MVVFVRQKIKSTVCQDTDYYYLSGSPCKVSYPWTRRVHYCL